MEEQRVKLAKELSRAETGRTVYILDEPTTGLHFADIQKLLDVIHRLTGMGNTVIVIEHNLDVISTADWIVDLGPGEGSCYSCFPSPDIISEPRSCTILGSLANRYWSWGSVKASMKAPK